MLLCLMFLTTKALRLLNCLKNDLNVKTGCRRCHGKSAVQGSDTTVNYRSPVADNQIKI